MLFEKQDYQHQCVENILSILSQVDVRKGDYSNLADAIKEHYKNQSYTQFRSKDEKQLDVLMETGTGKTYTYLKTIFELYKNYACSKFIIVLPRVAIKLGVIQNIQLTDEHFYNEYKHHLKYIDYPQGGIDEILNSFVRSDDLCILLLTDASFNKKEDNVINKRRENLFEYSSTWHAIADKKPIVFIDEPHLLKGGKTTKALEELHKSLFIRFGATYPREEEHALCNVAYVLDSISSFQKYLVKQIRVHTVSLENEQESLRVTKVQGTGKKATIHCVCDKNTETFLHKLCVGDDVGAKTGLERYKGISITKATHKNIFLSNKTTISVGSATFTLSDEEITQMVRETIMKHFEKEEALFTQGIKALSLFFIPSIADFRQHGDNKKPRIKTIFEREYKDIRRHFYKEARSDAYKKYLERDYEDGILRVHEGYFSGDKGNSNEKETQGVSMILKDKEKLLHFDTPLRFIFSVWALQEGWDNPNVSTLCKLASTHDISRRQQVGRGLRLVVNQAGKRSTSVACEHIEHEFYKQNTLDVVVSKQEKEFIYEIQQEIQDASYSIVQGTEITVELLKQYVKDEGVAARVYCALEDASYIQDKKLVKPLASFLYSEKERLSFLSDEDMQCLQKALATHVHPVLNGNIKTPPVRIKKNKWKEFRELWEMLNKKACIVYKDIKEEEIIQQVAEQFQKECQSIDAIKIKIETKKYNAQTNKVEYVEQHNLGNTAFFQSEGLQDFVVEVLVKHGKFPLHFIVKLCRNFTAECVQTIQRNPRKSKEVLLHLLKECIHASVIHKVGYEFLETSIYPNDLQDENTQVKDTIESGVLGRYITRDGSTQEHLLYDTVCYDSEIERKAQQEDSPSVNGNTIIVFAKLPKISIPTPYKTYSPDFGYVIKTQADKTLFLVVETKGYDYKGHVPKEEVQKMDYAKKFFDALNKQLHSVDIHYETRTNSEELSAILSRSLHNSTAPTSDDSMV